MSIHYGQFCPISKAAEVLGERWTILIIRELLVGTTRYSDFQRALSKISPTLLTKRLNQLVDCGLVSRQMNAAHPPALLPVASPGSAVRPGTRSLDSPARARLAGPRPNLTRDIPQRLDLARRSQLAGNVPAFNSAPAPDPEETAQRKRVQTKPPGQSRATYHLTPAGLELKPLVFGLGEWGAKWARGQMRDDELDVELLMTEFCRRIDSTKLPGSRAVIGFTFPSLAKFVHWWIVFQPDRERELCVDHPGKDVDLLIRTSVRTMVEIWSGDTDLRAALKEGRLRLSGDPVLIRTLTSWLRPGMSAHIRPDPRALRV